MTEKGLDALRSAIKDKGHTWEAGATPLSDLTAAEQKSHLGLTVDKQELEATQAAIAAAERLQQFRAPIAAPAKIDWRNNGGDWTTPIKDQKNCGSCVAFGTAATIEARINIVCKNASIDKDLSEAHLFYCGCGNCCGSGWNFPPALDFCKNTGIGLEADFPYTDHDQPCKAGVSPFVKLTGWTAVLSMADRKNVIATKGPVVAGMAVFQDFFSYKTGVYKHTTGNLAGYHAVCVVGYDDAEGCWICKNSWGTSWGDGGWFKIAYGECQIDTSFAFYDVDLACPQPVDLCAKYKAAAQRYYLLFKRTGNRKYLCTSYRYLALYYSCCYRTKHDRRCLCLYYRYMAEYHYCLYAVTRDKRHLEYYERYKAAYQKCR